MSKKHAVLETAQDEEIVVNDVVDLPEVPARFYNGGAPAHERDAWIAEHRPDLLEVPEPQPAPDES